MNILITLNDKKNTYKAIKKDNIYTYKDQEFIVVVDTKKNIITRKNKTYKLNLKFKEKTITKNICEIENKKFTIEIKTDKIINNNHYHIEYKVLGGEKIKYTLEEIND